MDEEDPQTNANDEDGGLVAWLQVVGACALFLNSWFVG